MKLASQAQSVTTPKPAATNSRNFRTFLLVAQLEAKAIGQRLQAARKEAGLTQDQVAEVSTVSKRSLQAYEAGVTIPYRHFRELAGIYDCEVSWLMHGKPDHTDEAPDGLLAEVATSVATHSEAMRDVIDRLARIEALLESREGGDANARRP